MDKSKLTEQELECKKAMIEELKRILTLLESTPDDQEVKEPFALLTFREPSENKIDSKAWMLLSSKDYELVYNGLIRATDTLYKHAMQHAKQHAKQQMASGDLAAILALLFAGGRKN